MPNSIYEYCGVVKCLRQKMEGRWEIPFLGGRQPLKRGDERYVKTIVINFKKLTVLWQYLFLITMYSMLVICAPQYHVMDWLIFMTNN